MKIGIIGAGMVGENLGKAFLKVGHEVMFSSRDPHSDKMQALAQSTGATVGTVAETVAFGEVIALTLNWNAVEDAIQQGGNWAGKIVIDPTNRFGQSESNAQLIAKWTGASVVKAFNSIGAEHYLDPIFGGMPASMLLVGDDAHAKNVVKTLTAQIGFEPIDAGTLADAPLVEKLAELWVHLAFRAGQGRNFAFKLIRK